MPVCCCMGVPLLEVAVVRACPSKVQHGAQSMSARWQDACVCSNHLHLKVLSKFELLVQSDAQFWNGVTVTVLFLVCALAVCTAVLSACWALLILTGFFLSACLVAVFLSALSIAMVVVVVDKKEREERRLLTLSLLQLIGRVHESNNCEDLKRNSNERQQPSREYLRHVPN